MNAPQEWKDWVDWADDVNHSKPPSPLRCRAYVEHGWVTHVIEMDAYHVVNREMEFRVADDHDTMRKRLSIRYRQ